MLASTVDFVNLALGQAGVLALLGYAVVFFGLILLMVVITILGKAFTAKKAPVAAPAAPAAPAAAPAGATQVKAPLQGNVLKVLVKPGDTVKKGSPVCVIEALKMENDVPAPADGVVASVLVKSGDSVKTDEVLLTLN